MHGVIALTTVLLETGMLPMREPVTTLTLEPPAGPIAVTAHCEGGRVKLVEIDNVESFATALDVPLEVPGYGTVPVSVAWGGMGFAVVDARHLGLELLHAVVPSATGTAAPPAALHPAGAFDRDQRRDGQREHDVETTPARHLGERAHAVPDRGHVDEHHDGERRDRQGPERPGTHRPPTLCNHHFTRYGV